MLKSVPPAHLTSPGGRGTLARQNATERSIMTRQRSWTFLIAGIALAFPVSTYAQSTSFTYQGLLQNDGAPVDAKCDFQFRLFDAVSAGEEVADAQSVAALPVTHGVFTASVDFGAEAFPDEDRWLQIA